METKTYIRLNIGILISTITVVLLIITSGIIDNQVRKNNTPIWKGVSPRIPDPKHCEVFVSDTKSNSTSYINNGTIVNGTIVNGTIYSPFNNTVINNTEAFLIERYNSYSSIIFLYSSIIPLFFFTFDLKQRCNRKKREETKYDMSIMARYPIYSFIIFLISMGWSIGTFTNHACSCKEGLIADNIGQWLVLGLYLFYSLFIFTNNYTKSRTILTYIVWIILYVIYSIVVIILALANISILASNIITLVMILAIIITNIIGIFKNSYITGNKKLFWASFVISIIGIVFGILDYPLCRVGSSINFPKVGLHFIYHIMEAIAITLLYLFHWSLIEDFDYIKSILEENMA